MSLILPCKKFDPWIYLKGTVNNAREVNMATFRERFLKGEIPFDDIFDLTDEWNMSDNPETLREYLGLTAQEEDVWIDESDEALEELMNREKNRKILFSDIDGTLLCDDKTLPDDLREVLHEISAKGHPIVLSTGRYLPSALRQFKQLGIPSQGCYLISCNGAQIYDIGADRMVRETRIDRENVLMCFDAAEKFGIHIQTYNRTHVISRKDTPDLQLYCKIQKIPSLVTDDIYSVLENDPPKLLVIDEDHDRVVAFHDLLKELSAGKVDCFFSNPWYLEIVSPGINKGWAVKWLCDHLLIPLEHSVAAGDAENDISMIKAAGHGIAMLNATQDVKDSADLITEKDNNHSGLVSPLKKLFLDTD